MTETIKITLDIEDKKIFEASIGMQIGDYVKLLIDNIKYGGKAGLDPFWSEENQKHLKKSIDEFKENKSVNFSAEEWEKFTNAQEI